MPREGLATLASTHLLAWRAYLSRALLSTQQHPPPSPHPVFLSQWSTRVFLLYYLQYTSIFILVVSGIPFPSRKSHIKEESSKQLTSGSEMSRCCGNTGKNGVFLLCVGSCFVYDPPPPQQAAQCQHCSHSIPRLRSGNSGGDGIGKDTSDFSQNRTIAISTSMINYSSKRYKDQQKHIEGSIKSRYSESLGMNTYPSSRQGHVEPELE